MVETKNTEEQPKKKGHGCLIAFLLFLFLIAAVVGGGYWGYKKLTSSLSKQIDLNVTYSQEDMDLLMSNLGADANPTSSYPHVVELTITSQQATAFVNVSTESMKKVSIKDTQIKFSEEKAEISTILTYKRERFPIYATGNVSKATDHTISVNLYDVKIGDISIPKALQDYVETALESMANSKLSELGDTLRIDNFKFTDNGLRVVGLIPSEEK